MQEIAGMISLAASLILSALALIISLLALIASAYFYYGSARQLQKSTRQLQDSMNKLTRYLELTIKDANVKPIRNKDGDTTGFNITMHAESGNYAISGADATLTKDEKKS